MCFVCLGNICRSPTAEGVLLHFFSTHPLRERVIVDSAGTAAYHVGSGPDRRSLLHAERRGYHLPSRARQFQAADFARFDFVLAMDSDNLSHLAELRSRSSEVRSGAHLGLLRDFDPEAAPGSSVPDPYYGGAEGFEEVLNQCERAAKGLRDVIVARLSA